VSAGSVSAGSGYGVGNPDRGLPVAKPNWSTKRCDVLSSSVTGKPTGGRINSRACTHLDDDILAEVLKVFAEQQAALELRIARIGR